MAFCGITIAVMSSRDCVTILMLMGIGISMGRAAINDTLNPGLTDFSETSNFTCVDRPLGSYYPDYETKCQKFHLCATGEAGEVLNLSFLCPEGAAFDERAADCLPGAIVNCDPNSTFNSSSSSPRSVRKAAKKSDLRDDAGASYNTSFKCRGKKLGRYYADQETGCRLFHLCAPGSSIKSELYDFQFLCLAGTLFDNDRQKCLEDGKVSTATCNVDGQMNEDVESDVMESDVTVMSSLRRKRDSNPLKVERLWKVKASSSDHLSSTKPSKMNKNNNNNNKALKIRTQRAIDPPSYDQDNMPETSFSCEGRVQGGYYADVEAGCQMYHVCSVGPDHQVRNFKFLCSNGTVFSQQTRTCQTWYTVDCDTTSQFFALNDELPKLAKEEAAVPATIDDDNQLLVNAARDNRDFLPSHRSTARRQQLQEQQQARQQNFDLEGPPSSSSSSTFQPEPRPPSRPAPRPIQQTTDRPAPQFHAVFQEDEVHQTLGSTTRGLTRQAEDVDAPPAEAEGQSRGRKRVRGRRKRIRNRDRVQSVEQSPEQQQQPVQQEQELRQEQQQEQEHRLEQQEQELRIQQQRQQQERIILQRQHQEQELRIQQQREQQEQQRQQFSQAPEVTTPTVLIIDQGNVGLRSRIPGLSEEDPSVRPGRMNGQVLVQSSRRQPSQRARHREQEQQEQQQQQSADHGLIQINQRPRHRQQPDDQSSGLIHIEAQNEEQPSRPRFRVQQEQSTSSPLSMSGFDQFIQNAMLEEERQREELRQNTQIEQRRLRADEIEHEQRLRPNQQQELETVTSRPTPSSSRRPAAGRRRRPTTTTTTRRPSPAVVVTRPPTTHATFRTSRPPPQRPSSSGPNSIDVTAPTSGILPELHQIPLFEVQPSGVRPVHQSWPVLQPVSISQPTSTLRPTTLLLQPFTPATISSDDGQQQHQQRQQHQSVDWSSLGLIDLNSGPSGGESGGSSSAGLSSSSSSNVDDIQSMIEQQQRGGGGGFILSPIHEQPSTVSDIFLLVPSAPAGSPSLQHQLLTPASTQHMDFSVSRQRRALNDLETRPSTWQSSRTSPTSSVAAASQFLEYDSALLTAGGPSSIPPTSFTCKGKVMGGYYADLPTDCKMFHICSSGWQRSVIYDYRFLCGNGTGFDQRSLTCTTLDTLDCPASEAHYPKHPLAEELEAERTPNAELRRIRVKRAPVVARPVSPVEYPATDFSCAGRENGRYYADAETNCELFHLCAEVSGGHMQKHSFLCPNNTVFDQRSQACDDQTDLLNCIDDPPHHGIDEIFSRI